MANAQADIHATALAELSQLSLGLPVLDEEGCPHTVSRLHSGGGNWLIAPPMPRYQNTVYVPIPAVEKLLRERKDIMERRKANSDALEEYAIRLPRVYFGQQDKREVIARVQGQFRQQYEAIAQKGGK